MSEMKNQRSLLERVLNKVTHRFGFSVVKTELLHIPRIFDDRYGYCQTLTKRKPIDVDLNPLPWFTYPAIEYLTQLDLKNKNIFEWGSGHSSLFFAERCKTIISVESNPEWFAYMQSNLKPNQKVIFSDEDSFPHVIRDFDEEFDIISIDSLRRYDCAVQALKSLKDGGLIILDNADWHPKTSTLLRVQGNLLEVDMHGFGPINAYTWTTSFYFHRNFRFNPLHDLQPGYSKAAIAQISSTDKLIGGTE
jgi:hypothetical protein